MTQCLLETRGLSRNFGALAAVKDVDFRLDAGARHALIGPNGAGKTTLINLLTGVLQPSHGCVMLKGHDITSVAEARRVKLGIARTFQINRLFRGLSVLENVCIAIAERVGAAGRMFRPAGARRDVLDEAMSLLTTLKLAEDAGRRILELPYGRQRLVEIAIALGLKPEVLLLDEPAAGVPSAESHIILDAIAHLPRHIAVLIIEHDMDVVFRFAGRITVMVGGKVFAEGTPDEITARLGGLWRDRRARGYQSHAPQGREHQHHRTQWRRQIDPAGNGHGSHHAAQGEVVLNGRSLNRIRVYDRALMGLGFVPQEREIFPSLTIRENLQVGARSGPWTEERVLELFPNLSDRLGHKGNQLSGGEQQMLAIARALLTNPSVLLMDEPTEGLAPVIVERLTAILRDLRDSAGLSIVLVEQNSRVALDFSSRTVVMDKGRIVYDGASAALQADPTLIANALLNKPDVQLRLLVRPGRQRGAQVVEGVIGPDAGRALASLCHGASTVISAVQGGPDVIIDGQAQLLRAARHA